MGLFDKVVSGVIKGLVNINPATIPGLAMQYLSKTELGDVNGLLKRLRQGGLDREVESWLGPGPNLPVSPDQLRDALGEDVIEQFAAATGFSADELLAADGRLSAADGRCDEPEREDRGETGRQWRRAIGVAGCAASRYIVLPCRCFRLSIPSSRSRAAALSGRFPFAPWCRTSSRCSRSARG